MCACGALNPACFRPKPRLSTSSRLIIMPLRCLRSEILIDIVVNATPRETRIALLEQRLVTELFIERHTNHGLVGNIYCGRVAKILPGMQAAFVDIGLPKAGFLHVSDILVDPHTPPWSYETTQLDLGNGNDGS